MQTHSLELERATRLSPSVRLLVFRASGTQKLEWIPGQYLELYQRERPELKVPYSIASPMDGEQPGRFEIALAEISSADFVLKLLPGQELCANGPSGTFVRRGSEHQSALFVGAGTGVAPLRAMIVEELRQLNGAELALLFGSRSEADILWGAEFSALARAQRNFLFEPSLSQPSDDWRGRRGYVQQHLLELVTSLRPSEIYICGPAAMVTGCLAVLESDAVASSTRICSETQ